jgi:hypothetical protein
MKKIICLFCLSILLFATLALAHQPRLVYKKDLSHTAEIVKNPKLSQAFYGELKGKPDLYQISVTGVTPLFLQILAPDISDLRKDFSLAISNDKHTLILDGKKINWLKFHEGFANDDYWTGPELNKQIAPGTYSIKIYNPDNHGKYVLIIGNVEQFPLHEQVSNIALMPALKLYFGKSPFTAYFNEIGLFALVYLLLLLGIIVAFYLLIKFIVQKIRS